MKYAPSGRCFSESARPVPVTVGASTGSAGSVRIICGARGASERWTPISRRSPALHAPAATTIVSPAKVSVPAATPRTRPPSRSRRAAVPVWYTAPRAAAASANARVVATGLACPSVGLQAAATTVSTSPGARRRASAPSTTRTSRPASRSRATRSSRARRSASFSTTCRCPPCRNSISAPNSAARPGHRRDAPRVSAHSRGSRRCCRTPPALAHEALGAVAGGARSTTATRVPRSTRWYAIEEPVTPPPTITTSTRRATFVIGRPCAGGARSARRAHIHRPRPPRAAAGRG